MSDLLESLSFCSRTRASTVTVAWATPGPAVVGGGDVLVPIRSTDFAGEQGQIHTDIRGNICRRTKASLRLTCGTLSGFFWRYSSVPA